MVTRSASDIILRLEGRYCVKETVEYSRVPINPILFWGWGVNPPPLWPAPTFTSLKFSFAYFWRFGGHLHA